MSPLEVVGFVAGILCVALAVRRDVRNFAVGIVSTAAFIVVFAQAGLYANAGLQVVFVLLGIQGWWAWARSREGEVVVPVRSFGIVDVLGAAAGTVALTLLVAGALDRWTDSEVVWWDAATTASSLVAQYLLNRRILLTWIWWTGTDVALIGLYASQGLVLTSALYVVFLGLCLTGWVQWRAARMVVA